jgi:hypothetical protein
MRQHLKLRLPIEHDSEGVAKRGVILYEKSALHL